MQTTFDIFICSWYWFISDRSRKGQVHKGCGVYLDCICGVQVVRVQVARAIRVQLHLLGCTTVYSVAFARMGRTQITTTGHKDVGSAVAGSAMFTGRVICVVLVYLRYFQVYFIRAPEVVNYI